MTYAEYLEYLKASNLFGTARNMEILMEEESNYFITNNRGNIFDYSMEDLEKELNELRSKIKTTYYLKSQEVDFDAHLDSYGEID